MIVYRTQSGLFVEDGEKYFVLAEKSLDALINREDLPAYLQAIVAKQERVIEFDSASIEARRWPLIK